MNKCFIEILKSGTLKKVLLRSSVVLNCMATVLWGDAVPDYLGVRGKMIMQLSGEFGAV